MHIVGLTGLGGDHMNYAKDGRMENSFQINWVNSIYVDFEDT